MKYQDWIQAKSLSIKPSGFTPVDLPSAICSDEFKFQQLIVERACRQGRFCIFADCGMGKGPMLLAWADQVVHHTGGDVLVLAPLAVSQQLQREANKFDIAAHVAQSQSDVEHGINITNYEKLSKFDSSRFVGVVLDESSILKSQTGKYRTEIIELFKETPYKLACSATPSPNDHMELGNHAEFMGVMTREEMLAMFFTHDGGNTSNWRLKGHAVDKFWDWVCEWAIMIRKPSDLGFDDGAFQLPPLKIQQQVIRHTIAPTDGQLFFNAASTLTEQRKIRKASLQERCQLAADLVNDDKTNSQWLVFCDLNDESAGLSRLIDGAIEVKGSDKDSHKESSMIGFQDGDVRVLVSKPSICGFGMNFQGCHNIVFVGLSHSYEAYYQALRRCYRFGQTQPVNAYVVFHEGEGAVIKNIMRKEADTQEMAARMVERMHAKTMALMGATARTETEYKPSRRIKLASWLIESSLEAA
ncbi:helicase [Leptolyngbyaceae cyanobacterium CCMR0082]|uniref:Helicase n=1 Tax=Adonisia turfae CCMR0082 TaxID=2304604 RepID=A0A6M0RZD8_9CYAN|nr:helicase [Adonisia turfae CCMR0082]